jgi:hypothetical protein
MTYYRYGNWCGPGWSNGRAVSSERGTAPAIDDYDDSCREHDFTYADDGDLVKADYEFARRNLGTASIQRNVAGLGVLAQGLARHAAIKMTQSSPASKRLRSVGGTCAAMPTPPSQPRPTNPRPRVASAAPRKMTSTMLSKTVSRAAPVAYSNTVHGYSVSSNGGVTTVRGREFAGGGQAFNSSITQLADVIMHHPAYYTTSVLGNLARSYREYKWEAIKISYLGVCSTATAGWTQISTNPDMQDSAYAYSTNADLLQRGMSTQNSVLGNNWENIEHVVPLPRKWCLTQPADGDDIRDHIAGETYVHQNAQVTGTIGLTVIDYVVSFRDLFYTLHSTIPYSQYATFTLTDSSAASAANAIVSATNSTVTSSQNGAVWRFVVLGDQCAIGTGGTLASNWKTYFDATTSSTLTIKNGTTFYGQIVGSNILCYPTFEAAKLGSKSTYLAYVNLLSTASTYVVIGARLTHGAVELINQS